MFIFLEKMEEIHLSPKVKTLVEVFLVLTVLIMFSPIICAEWWDNSWPYRRAITISGSHPENYQLRIVLPFFDNSIRFTENESGPLLPYWVENWTSDNMTVWVRRYQANDGTDNTIYVYYGNPNAYDNSNLENTMDCDSQTQYGGTTYLLGYNPTAWGQRKRIENKRVWKIGFPTALYSSGSGNLTFTIRRVSDGSIVQSKAWGPINSLPTSAAWIYVTFTGVPVINEDVRILFEYSGNGRIDAWQNSDVKANEWQTDYSVSVGWEEDTASDAPYVIYTGKYVYPEPTTSLGAGELGPVLFATDLKTENQINPSRISTSTPTFNVTCLSTISDIQGENLELQVASDNSFATILWDAVENFSQAVENSQRVTIIYSGPSLCRGTTYYWRARWYYKGHLGSWSDLATFRIADMQITSIGADSTLIDRKKDWSARDNVTISVRIREEEGADAALTCKLSVRDATGDILLDNLILVDKSILDSENVIFTYIYNPPDNLLDSSLGSFEVRVIAEDNLGSRIWDWVQMFTVDDIRVSASLLDNTPIYRIGLSGNAFRVYDNASTTLDNVVIVDNNEGEIQATFSENSFSGNYGLISPVRLHHGDLGRIYVLAKDDILDGTSPILTYQVEGDNLRILNPIRTRYADRTEVVFEAKWASDGTNVGYGTVCLPENSQISCQVLNGSGTLIIPHSSRVNSGNKILTCPDDADRPIWVVLSQSFSFNILPWAENLRADNRPLPARVTPSPVFSWAFGDNNPNDSQLAFRIQVSSTPDNNDIWEYTGSGSANSVGYGGSLARGQTYYVRMIVEDTYGEWQNADNENKWSTSWFKVNQLPVVTNLLIDGQTNPSASSLCPVFSWTFSDNDGDVQSHYEIWVGTSPGSDDVWNSGQLASSSNSVTYGGPSLVGGRTYYVQVRTKDGLEWSDWIRGFFTTSSSAPPPTALQPSSLAPVSQQMTGVENIDNTPPELTWVVSNHEGETLYLVFECWDNSGILTVEAWVDNETVQVSINGKRVEIKAENLEEGLHTVLIRVTDVCGNENVVLLNYKIRRPKTLPPVISTMTFSGSSLHIEVLNRESRELVLEAHLYLDGRLFKVLPITLRPLEHSWVEVEIENLEPGNHEMVLRDAKGNLLGIRSLSILPAVANPTPAPTQRPSLTFWVGFSSAIGAGLVGLRIFTRRRRKAPPAIKMEEIPEVVRSLAPLLKEKND